MDIGKSAKQMGELHPRDLKKLDPVPVRPTPKKVVRRKPPRDYGYSYEVQRWRFGQKNVPWKRVYVWFDNAKSRDQAMSARQKQGYSFERGFREEHRGAASQRNVDGAAAGPGEQDHE